METGTQPPPPPGQEEAESQLPPVTGTAKHTAIYLSGVLISRAVGFAMLPFYTHYLTPADYGIMQLLQMTLDVIMIIAGNRIATGIHRYYFKAENDADRNAVLSTATILLALSFLASGALVFTAAAPLTKLVLGSAEHADLIRIAAVTLALQSLILVPLGIIQLGKRSALYTAITTGKLILQLTLNILLLAVAGMGLKGVFLSNLIADLGVGIVLTAMITRRTGLRFSGSSASALLRYGLPLVGTQFATFFVAYGDRYFLRVSADISQVGLYSLAYQFGFIVVSIGFFPFSMVWTPTRFQVATRPDRDAHYSRAFVFMNVMQLIATVGCALFVRDFILVMTAPAFHSAYAIVPIILAAYMLQSWAWFHESGILVKERTDYVTLANWIGALAALVGYAVLIPRWLGWGAAVATLLAFLVRWTVTYIIAQRLFPIRYDWKPVIQMSVLSTVVVVAGLVLPHPNVVWSVLMRSVLFVAYLWGVWEMGAIGPDEKRRILAFARSPMAALGRTTA